LLLAGEPGIGKSRLLWEVVGQARSGGFTVLASGCQRRGGHEPYAPLPAALRHHIRQQRPDRLREELQGCAWLIRLLPELVDGPVPPLPSWTLTPEQEQHLMVEAVIRFLTNVAGLAGTLLVLDDLQWADPDALDLLTTLVRSAPDLPLRIIGAYRDTEVQPQDALSTLLADLAPAGLAARRSLAPLAPEEAVELLDQLLEGTDAGEVTRREEVLQRAGGMPFFLVSCAHALCSGEAEEALPWDVAQSVRQRVAALPGRAQELLRTATVIGRVVPRALLVGVATWPEEEVLAAFDAICRAQLLEETADDAYQFVHDVIREVVEADLGAARCRVVHRQVAEVLEQSPGESPVELLAYHYARSDVVDKAVLYVEQAGDRAQTANAHTSAAAYYRELLRLLEERGGSGDADRARVARGWENLGGVLKSLARYDEALTALERSAALYGRQGDIDGAGRVVARIGRVHVLRGMPDEGFTRVRPVVEILASSGLSPSLAGLYAAMAELHDHVGRYEAQLDAAQRAVESASAVHDTRGLAEANATRGGALTFLLRFDEALSALREAAQLAEGIGDLPILYKAHSLMIGLGVVRGRLAEAHSAGDRTIDVVERLNDPEMISIAYSSRTWASLMMGNWDEAGMDLDRALSLGREIGAWDATAFALLQHGRLCVYRGDWETASLSLEECVEMAEQSGNLFHLRSAHALLAEREVLTGHPEEACARLGPLVEGSMEVEGLTITEAVRPTLIWAHVELGDLDRANEMLECHMVRVKQVGHLPALTVDLWLHAEIATRRADWEEAKSALDKGLTLARHMLYPRLEGRLLTLYGQMHIEKRELRLARELLEDALAVFRRLGAKKDVERTEQVLEKLDA
jgi:tetratricopeptide (TPR) repeat protein